MNRLPLAALLAAAALLPACSHPQAQLREEQQDLQDLKATRSADPEALRVMSFNIKSGLMGLDKVADAINQAQPQLVALQEVDVGTDRSHGLDEAQRLGELTHMPYARFFRATHLHGGDYGIALLSRLPVTQVEQRMLPTQGKEPRTAVHAVVDYEGREVSVYLTHLSMAPLDGKLRELQSQVLLSWMAADARPKLLLGDLNSAGDSLAIQALTHRLTDVFGRSGHGEADTFPPPLPLMPAQRIDYVLADSGFQPVASRVLHVHASDHYPLVADVALVSGATPPGAPSASPGLAQVQQRAPVTSPASPTR